MTNEMIILWESVRLMNEGLIGTTGRSIKVVDLEGNEKVLMEPEEIHTFAHWKNLGYSVKKGEKAVAKFYIWNGTEKAVKDENGNDTDEKTLKMFRKCSSFFSLAQVEPLKDRKPHSTSSRKVNMPAAASVVPSVAVPDAGYGSWLN